MSSRKLPPALQGLDVARNLLERGDLVRCKNVALRTLELDPLLDGVDEVLAVANVLLAATKRINNHFDWYSILDLDSNPSSSSVSLDAIRMTYRRLARLLNPEINKSAGAESAFKLVQNAWSVLSDPVKRSLYDKERDMCLDSAKIPSPQPMQRETSLGDMGLMANTTAKAATFWTNCPYCYHLYEYVVTCINRNLLCQNCRNPFRALELKNQKQILPLLEACSRKCGYYPVNLVCVPPNNPGDNPVNSSPPSVPRSGVRMNVDLAQSGQTADHATPMSVSQGVFEPVQFPSNTRSDPVNLSEDGLSNFGGSSKDRPSRKFAAEFEKSSNPQLHEMSQSVNKAVKAPSELQRTSGSSEILEKISEAHENVYNDNHGVQLTVRRKRTAGRKRTVVDTSLQSDMSDLSDADIEQDKFTE